MEVTVISKARILATSIIASLAITGIIVTFAYGSNVDDDATVAEKYINMEEAPSTSQLNSIAQIIDISLDDEHTIRVGLTEDYLNVNYTSLETDAELSVVETSDDFLDIKGIVDTLDVAREELQAEYKQAEEERERQARISERTYSLSRTQGGLLDIANPDPNYTGTAVNITGNDRVILEKLVMGEAGNQGFEGAALVAQCIRDMYLLGGYDSVESVRVNCGYSARLTYTPNQDVLDAVSYIFDQGGYAVKHRILYFYAPRASQGRFHNTQNNIIDYKDHRFFDRW